MRIAQNAKLLPAAKEEDATSAYAIVWCIQLVVSMKRYADEKTFLIAAAVIALSNRQWLGILFSHLIFIGLRIWRQPNQFNSDIWAALMDCVVLIVTSTNKQKNIKVSSVAVRKCLGILYFAAGFWKLNTSHLNPETSCSTIFFVTLASRWGINWPLRLIAHAAGFVTILLECTVGIFLYTNSPQVFKTGAIFGLLLHCGISLTPAPNNISAFSAMSSSRYFFVAPDGIANAFEFFFQRINQKRIAYFFIPSIILLVLLAQGVGIYDICFVLIAIIIIFGIIADSSITKQLEVVQLPAKCCILLVFFYAFAMMPLGLQDMGNTHMFSNMRFIHSNHLILPTGLLQSYLGQSQGPGPFDGGIIRILSTTNQHFSAIWPNEVSYRLPSTGRTALRKVGHSGREFLPLLGTIYGPQPTFSNQTVQYAIHAYELRRMIADARRLDHRNFSLTYTHLSNVSSRIDWQRALDPPEFFVHFQVNENGQISCLRRFFNSRKTIPCNIDADIALQPWPPKVLAFSFLF